MLWLIGIYFDIELISFWNSNQVVRETKQLRLSLDEDELA